MLKGQSIKWVSNCVSLVQINSSFLKAKTKPFLWWKFLKWWSDIENWLYMNITCLVYYPLPYWRQRFSNCSPQASSLSSTWTCVRNINSQTPPKTSWLETDDEGQQCVNTLSQCFWHTLVFENDGLQWKQRGGQEPTQRVFFSCLSEGHIIMSCRTRRREMSDYI